MSHFFLVAGEASGDLHASKLVRELKSLEPKATFRGIGGEGMRQQGVDLLVDASQLCVVGLTEIWERLGRIRSALRQARNEIIHTRPTAVILVDYPDFNLRLAESLHHTGIPIIYYISPQVWAWRAGRIHQIQKLVSKMLVIFPFEQDLYRTIGVNVEYVGHPLMDEISQELRGFQPHEFRNKLELDPNSQVLCLMPGSRPSEIRNHFQTFLDLSLRLKAAHPHLQMLLPVAPTLHATELANQIKKSGAPIQLVNDNATQVLAISDCAVVASGTSTLQAGLLGIPLVIVYKVAPVSWFVFQTFFRKTPYLGLPNIVLNQGVAPELIQENFTVEKIFQEVDAQLRIPERRQRIRENLGPLKTLLGLGDGASRRAAKSILDTVQL